MISPLGDRLSAARHRLFVGRAMELSAFRSALEALELPFHLLYIVGPGGVGKSTLLREFTHHLDQTRIPAFYLDAHDIEPSPEGFLTALRRTMGLSATETPLQALASRADRTVILIDTFEALAELNRWLREVFLPQLPANTLVVLADRQPPSAGWRIDPGWQTMIHSLFLRNLSPEESRAYLTLREIPPESHPSVLNFAQGYPLALSLVADLFDQRPGIQFQPEAAPDVVKILLEKLLQKVPGPAHRKALEACALVRLTTETLLAEMLGLPDASELFDWLRDLSFIESGRWGLFPHDLAREALIADVRWRNPDWYAELHQRARRYYAARLQRAHGQDQQGTLIDYIFLHRDNPVVQPFFGRLRSQQQGSSEVETHFASECDWPALVQMVADHEGEESARIAAGWFERQPDGILVVCHPQEDVEGFLAMVELSQANAGGLGFDPGAQAAWRYLQSAAPLRSGESATHFRFWMARDTYQDISPIQSLISVNAVRHALTRPGLAYTFFPCALPEFWAPLFAYAGMARIPEADFEVGGRRYGVYGQDWRATPPMVWLNLLAEREIGGMPQAVPRSRAVEPLVVLSRPDFRAAVRDALISFSRPDALLGNPLLRSRLTLGAGRTPGSEAGEAERIEALRAQVRQACEALQSSPRDMKLYRALYHTYLQPAPSQALAAETLDLPYSTFRRHLRAGVERVTEILWLKEIGAMEQ